MRALSKSKLIAYRQCPRRLWLEIHQPEARHDSAGTEGRFKVGAQVGEIARECYDPTGSGVLLDPMKDGIEACLLRTSRLLAEGAPIFEAGFRAEGALAFADVALPVGSGEPGLWRLVEVKSATSVKDYHRDDVAIQHFVATASGCRLDAVALACIDSTWVYAGDDNYDGLLVEHDLTDECERRADEVRDWIADAQRVLEQPDSPQVTTGSHCTSPFECGFLNHCRSLEPKVELPARWLPGRFSAPLKQALESQPSLDLRDVPDEWLSAQQMRVKQASINNEAYFDTEGAAQALSLHPLPAYFLDFESVQFAVPIWAGRRPYEQIPFQFSLHSLSPDGVLTHQHFLDLSGTDPARRFAEALLSAMDHDGPIFVYNAGFENGRLKELAKQFPDLAGDLMTLVQRVVDLLPIARDCYYHPSQQGSWSIKSVLPAICPELRYDALQGVQDGGMAIEAYLEAISPHTSASRRSELEAQLLSYCELDTFAMVKLWAAFSGSRLEI